MHGGVAAPRAIADRTGPGLTRKRISEKRTMTVTMREIISVNLVVLNLDLLTTNDAVRQFQTKADVDIRQSGSLDIDVLSGQSNQARTLHLDRDRINLQLSAARSTITKQFPAIDNWDNEVSRFAEVVDHAVSIGHDPGSGRYDFGYNAEIVFDQDNHPTAFFFLGDRLIKQENLNLAGRQFLGGACRLFMRDDHQRQWTYNLEPRFNDAQASRVFASVNLHHTQRPLPRIAETISAIKQIVTGTKDLMAHLSE